MMWSPPQLSDNATTEQIARRQLELLRTHVHYLDGHSLWYRRRFREIGFCAADLTALDQLPTLPLTTKSDLSRDNHDFLAVAEDRVVDICVTSGTTGEPITVWQTEGDLKRLAENEKQAFLAAGVRRGQRVVIAAALDRGFMAGLAYFLGLREIGAAIFRAGSSSLDFLAATVKQQRPQVMVGVPSLFLALAERLSSGGDTPANFGVEKLICIGEPVRSRNLGLSSLGEQLRQRWSAQVLGTYAATEIAVAFADCEHACGGHLLPELALIELIDEHGRAAAEGSVGEVVVTPLGIEGTPLLRYRTGDLAELHLHPCACGRQTPRLGPILGRREQMLKCRGTTLFPATIAGVLHDVPEITGHYLEVFRHYDLADEVKVVVGCRDAGLSAAEISARIAAVTRVRLEVEIRTPEEIMRHTLRSDRRKPVTFFDYRSSPKEQ